MVLPGCCYQDDASAGAFTHGCRCGALPEWARRFLCLALSNVGATSPSPSQVGQTTYVLLIYAAFALALESILETKRLHCGCACIELLKNECEVMYAAIYALQEAELLAISGAC